MCQQATCRTCGKITWRGCGSHVDQVMRGVPASRRCEGHPKEPGALARMFGRG